MIDYQLTKKEEDQLKLIERGLRTNEELPHDGVVVASLIARGLLVSIGISVRITPQGEEVLKSLRNRR